MPRIGHAEVVDRRVERRRALDVDALRAAGQDQRRRLRGRRPRRRVMRFGHDLGVDAQLAHPAGDELGVLRAEVDDEDGVLVAGSGRGSVRRSAVKASIVDGAGRNLLDAHVAPRVTPRLLARGRRCCSPVAAVPAPAAAAAASGDAPSPPSADPPTPPTVDRQRRSSRRTRDLDRVRQRAAPSRAAAARPAAAGARR